MKEQLCSREKALEIALDKINQGWTLSYISYGFEEWLGVKISPEELYDIFSDNPKVLPEKERDANAWHNIFGADTKNMTDINVFYLEYKYGYSVKYIIRMFEAYREGYEESKNNKETS